MTRLPSLRRTHSLDRLPFSETRRPRLAAGPLACIVMRRPATGDGGRCCLQTEPCRRDGPARVARLSEMSAYPCVDGLPAATEACGIAIGVVAPGVVAAGPGKPSAVHTRVSSSCPDRRHAVRRACRSVVSPSFGLTRPMRPRFGMSNRRPSSLRFASISRPQRPCSAFFPWSLRAHSSRFKKASPWPPSTAWRPCGCGPIASGQRQPSRSRWSRPEKRKRTRTWLPSATSP